MHTMFLDSLCSHSLPHPSPIIYTFSFPTSCVFLLFKKFNTRGVLSVGATSMYMGAEPSTGAWVASQMQHPWGKPTLSQQLCIVNSFSDCGGNSRAPPPSILGFSVGLLLCKACTFSQLLGVHVCNWAVTFRKCMCHSRHLLPFTLTVFPLLEPWGNEVCHRCPT